MSQFPLEGGGPSSPRSIRDVRPIQQLSQSEAPTARENLITRPDTFDRGAELAAQLDRALGGVAHVAGQLGSITAGDRREQEREDAKKNADNNAILDANEKSQAKQEAADRVSAAYSASIDAQEIAHKIETGDLTAPEGMDLKEAAAMFAQQLGRGDEHSDTFNEKYDAHVTPHVLAALYKQEDQKQAVKRAEAIAASADLIMAASDEAGVRSALSDIRTITGGKATETDILSGALVPAIESAAKAGNRAALDTRLAVLGDRLPDIRRKAEAEFAQAQTAQKRQAIDGFQNDIDRMLYDGVPQQAVEERMKSYGTRGGIPGTELENQKRRVEAHFAEQSKANLKAIADADFTDRRESLLSAFEPAIDAGIPIPKETVIARIDGREPGKLTDKDAIEIIGDRRVDRINQQIPADKFPAENLSARVENMLKMPRYVDPALQSQVSGVFSRIAANTSKENVPAASIQGLKLFRELGAQSTQVRDRLVSESDREPLRTAQFLLEHLSIEPADALSRISQVKGAIGLSDRTSVPLDPKDAKALRAAVGSTQNADGVYREAADVARAYSIYFDVPMNKAVEFATKRIEEDYVTLGSRHVRVAGRPAVRSLNLPAVNDAVVGAFKARNAEFKDEALSLGTDRAGNWVVLSDAGLPVGSKVLSDDSLAAIDHRIRDHDAEKKIAEVQRAAATYAMNAEGRKVAKGLGTLVDLPGLAGKVYDALAPQAPEVTPAVPPRPTGYDGVSDIFDFIDASRRKNRGAPPAKPTGPVPGGFNRYEFKG